MAKAILVYESVWGNTRAVAEKISEGLQQVPGMEIVTADIKGFDINKLNDFDIILIGTPNHMGGPTRNISNLANKLGNLKLSGKIVAVFDTYMMKDYQKATNKLEKIIQSKSPGLKLVSPGLSVQVTGMKGSIASSELPKCVEFGKMIAQQLTAVKG